MRKNIYIPQSCWENPFKQGFDNTTSIIMYEKHLTSLWPEDVLVNNLSSLKDKELIIDNASENNSVWTELEVIQKLMCKYGISTELTVVHRDILSNSSGIIVHQVNCQKMMGAGVAKQIKDKYPKVRTEFLKQTFQLGDIQIIEIYNDFPKLYVCNLAGQLHIKRKNSELCTSYDSVRMGFRKLNSLLSSLDNLPVFVPYKMGCGLAGGNWEIYSRIILEELPTAIVCKQQ